MRQHYRHYRTAILAGKKLYEARPGGKEWRMTYNRNYQMKRYGISQERFIELVVEQKGLCAMCSVKLATSNAGSGKQRRTLIYVDHDHKSGKVRGLVCPRCNTLLGLAKDDSALLLAAVNYLAQFTVELKPGAPANGPLAER